MHLLATERWPGEWKGAPEPEKPGLWEILVPTVRPNTEGRKFFTTRFHKVWDGKVRAITGGLTIMAPSKGQWVSPDGIIFRERMIPVRIACTSKQIHEVVKMTAEYYQQEVVMAYMVSDQVLMYNHPTIRNKS